MPMRLKDKVVLITGASRGVGAACAVACAREGARLALAAKTLEPHPKLPGTLRDVAREVEAAGSEAHVIQVDVRFAEAVEDMVQRTVDHFGRLDVLINNAGAIFLGPVSSWPAAKFDLVMAVNVRGAFLASHHALPHLRRSGGHLLMMSPPIRGTAAVGKAPYLVSKFGMTMLAQAIDAEESDVHACSLWPITAVRTAATVNLGLGADRDTSRPELLADAVVDAGGADENERKFWCENADTLQRSEERRVGKECRSRWSPYH
jgi:citronellol/citronellal dehydrogenase